jgi:hypothetical protein
MFRLRLLLCLLTLSAAMSTTLGAQTPPPTPEQLKTYEQFRA